MMSKILALALVASAAATVELNGADFDAAIAGKGVRQLVPHCMCGTLAITVPQAILILLACHIFRTASLRFVG